MEHCAIWSFDSQLAVSSNRIKEYLNWKLGHHEKHCQNYAVFLRLAKQMQPPDADVTAKTACRSSKLLCQWDGTFLLILSSDKSLYPDFIPNDSDILGSVPLESYAATYDYLASTSA